MRWAGGGPGAGRTDGARLVAEISKILDDYGREMDEISREVLTDEEAASYAEKRNRAAYIAEAFGEAFGDWAAEKSADAAPLTKTPAAPPTAIGEKLRDELGRALEDAAEDAAHFEFEDEGEIRGVLYLRAKEEYETPSFVLKIEVELPLLLTDPHDGEPHDGGTDG